MHLNPRYYKEGCLYILGYVDSDGFLSLNHSHMYMTLKQAVNNNPSIPLMGIETMAVGYVGGVIATLVVEQSGDGS